ncbi:cysteine desulfurase [Alkalimonas sp. MEB108]|uniref:cysteine desulfurase n=1 Tax=Alkalimonas cellulosilytica TaxID=3058395 RepID=A0ABU7J5A0_9GAMM|nr:cysteine desulfurase [Alkalimonas sp. MEB108]MEE2001455.1 cysteine desulfurase [Alkalimonas sp. MEB108]
MPVIFNVEQFRRQFPFFAHNPDWVYLDNAATSQKPQRMLDVLHQFYLEQNSNIHRGAHLLADRATTRFEQARQQIAEFIQAPTAANIVFTSGTTAALNQLAFGLMGTVLQPGDRILLTALEHHANIVSWQLHCQTYGVEIDVVPLTAERQLDLAAYQQLLKRSPKLVSFCHVSNVLGQVLPVQQMVALAQQAGALTVIDGAQGISFQPVDVQHLDCDFYVFSGHKVYGPTGIGVLYGKTTALDLLRPLLGGGEMIKKVAFSGSTYADLPQRLEAGTAAIAEAIALGDVLLWLSQQDRVGMQQHKAELTLYAHQQLAALPQIELLTNASHNAGIITFNVHGEHPSDVATLLNEQCIALRSGQHCAMPLFDSMALQGALRWSLAAYTTQQELDTAIKALTNALELLCPLP